MMPHWWPCYTAAMATAQAAEKVYRSTGEDSLIDILLSVGRGGWL